MATAHKLNTRTKKDTIQGKRCFFSSPGQLNSWHCHSLINWLRDPSFDFSVHYNDYNDYNDYDDYNDYNEYNEYNEYNDYNAYNDYNDYNG